FSHPSFRKETVMKLIRSALLGLLVLALVGTRQASAHFTWISSDDEGRVALFFGETPAERNYKLPEALADAKITSIDLEGEEEDVAVAKVDEKEFIGLRSEAKAAQSGIVATEVQYGNYHGTLLTYFAKHYVDEDPTAWQTKELKSPLALDAAAKKTDEGVDLQVTWKGQP